jgi:glycosyltransferase involved in cell wall biosynthesis
LTGKKKVTYFVSHPIQYQSPMLKFLSDRLVCEDFEVVYFTDHTLGGLDKQFGVNLVWDVPLLEGYNYVFLKNYSWKPAVSGSFFGLVNFGVVNYLIKRKPDCIIIHGWGYFSNILLLISAKLLGIKVLLRSESPISSEINRSKLNFLAKRFILSLCSGFLYIGKENKAFYNFFGICEKNLFFAPYCVDNNRFLEAKSNFSNIEDNIRSKLKIPYDHKVILYCGKLIKKKRPFDVLRSLDRIGSHKVSIIYVGTGVLEKELKGHVNRKNLSNVYFAGFVNQSSLFKYYMSADMFVLPSTFGETWGLVVNEAMLHSLPIIISNHVGCVPDLVREGINGFSYDCGNIDQLAEKINHLCSLDQEQLALMGAKSLEIIINYSFDEVLEGFQKGLDDC